MIFYMSAFVAVVLTQHIRSASAMPECICPVKTDQEKYCESDFVSLVLLKSKEVAEGNSVPLLKYHVHHQHVFKRPQGVSPLPSAVLTVADECGYTGLQVGSSYILAGVYDSDAEVLRTTKCGQLGSGEVIEYVDMPNGLKQFLLTKRFKCGN